MVLKTAKKIKTRTSKERTKITVGELEIGHYVSNLDVPWSATPFPIQGFHIRDLEDQTALARYCKVVEIDTTKTQELPEEEIDEALTNNKADGQKAESNSETDPEAEEAEKVRQKKRNRARSQLQKLDETPINIKGTVKYATTTSFKKEYKVAEKVYEKLESTMLLLQMNMSHLDENQVLTVKQSMNAMAESVIRNSEAFLVLSKMGQHKSDLLNHAIAATTLGLVFGRELGLHENMLSSLGMGILFSKVGLLRAKVAKLYEVPQLDDSFDDLSRKCSYIKISLDMTDQANLTNSEANAVICHHREHFDGTGYPNQLMGKQIPLLARIAAIAIHYEEMISGTETHKALSSADAIAKLFKGRAKKFQGSLIEVFTRSIGLYPPGSAVQLDDGRIGFVMSVPENNMLNPKIKLTYDVLGVPMAKPVTLDMLAHNKKADNDNSILSVKIQKGLSSARYQCDRKTFFGKSIFPLVF